MKRNGIRSAVLACVLLAGACGGSQNRRTISAYQAEVARCEANATAIVERDPATSTRERDQADLATERERCVLALSILATGGAQ